MPKLISQHQPLVWALIILIGVTTYTLVGSYRHNQGQFGYVLDDSYIHMAMAKNLAQHGVWGVTKYEFSSASSSLLWTSLLAGVYFLIGVGDHSPWIINLLCAIALLAVVYRILSSRKVPPIYTTLVLTGFIFILPLVPMIRTGMEHVAHALLAILFAWQATKLLLDDERTGGRFLAITAHEWNLIGLSVLLATVRYESLFEIGIVMLLFAARKRITYALTIGVASIIPIVAFGLISLEYGNYFIPNSLLIKADMPSFSSLGNTLLALGLTSFTAITRFPHLMWFFFLSLVVFVYAYYRQGRNIWSEPTLFLFLMMADFLIHMQFAKSGWFYRYESYLLGWGFVAMSVSIYENFPRPFVALKERKIAIYYSLTALLILLAGFHLGLRGGAGLIKTVPATTNIFEQQYQMGLFVREHYSGESILINDIGAISYLADYKCFDLVGLADIRVLRAAREKRLNAESLQQMCLERGVKIAIVYRSWLVDLAGIPKEWTPVGTWTIQNNIVCSARTVYFYAVDPEQESALRNNFRLFSKKLPATVTFKEVERIANASGEPDTGDGNDTVKANRSE